MIVWLASYPRSGNTLLRQILKGCFQVDSYESLGPPRGSPSAPAACTTAARQRWGHLETSEDRCTFYERASHSPALFFVKTHEQPPDAQKAIYVVRDGRLVQESFLSFQQHYHPGSSSFLSLLCSDHPFGDWSSHYRRWQARPGAQTLVVRFDELADSSPELVARLGEFIGHRGPVREWHNPHRYLRQTLPELIGEGRTHWQRNDLWTDLALGLFYTWHGSLLIELEYATPEEVGRHAFSEGSDGSRLAAFLRGLVARRWETQRVCDERLDLIQFLQRVCEERLELIHRLEGTCAERLDTIQRLKEICGERGEVINRLDAACRQRAVA